jgi:hypothetical protein
LKTLIKHSDVDLVGKEPAVLGAWWRCRSDTPKCTRSGWSRNCHG